MPWQLTTRRYGVCGEKMVPETAYHTETGNVRFGGAKRRDRTDDTMRISRPSIPGIELHQAIRLPSWRRAALSSRKAETQYNCRRSREDSPVQLLLVQNARVPGFSHEILVETPCKLTWWGNRIQGTADGPFPFCASANRSLGRSGSFHRIAVTVIHSCRRRNQTPKHPSICHLAPSPSPERPGLPCAFLQQQPSHLGERSTL